MNVPKLNAVNTQKVMALPSQTVGNRKSRLAAKSNQRKFEKIVRKLKANDGAILKAMKAARK